MKIVIPEGYEMPENVGEGDTFEELVTFTLSDGQLMPTMLAGIELASDDAEAETETEEAEADDMTAEDAMSMSALAGRMTAGM